MKILQWNCRGYRRNYGDLITLISTHQPICICLQETLLGDINPQPPKLYTMDLYNPRNLAHPGNGLAILVHRDCIKIPLNLNTPIQAMAVRIRFNNQLITMCNIYINPNNNLRFNDIQNLINQLPHPYLLLGDLNAKNPLWGGETTNQRGRIIEQLLIANNLCIMNTGDDTHFHVQTGMSSAIDVSLCSPVLLEQFSWSVEGDLHGSDHNPIVMEHLVGERVQREVKPIFKRADWKSFQALTAMDAPVEDEDIEQKVQRFTDVVSIATTVAIPHTRGGSSPSCVPWWNDECARAKIARKQALRRYQRTRSIVDKISYSRERAKAQFVQAQARRASWRDYVSSLTVDTPMPKFWRRIMKMNGKNQRQHKSHLICNGNEVTDEYEIATTLADHFCHTSSGQLAPPQFIATKMRQERIPIQLETEEQLPYNEPIAMTELHNALKHCKNSSPGPDRITYAVLRRLHHTAYSYLLDIYNTIWQQETFPNQWRVSTVLAFPKPGKPATDTSNYRPIALTTCVGKLLERIVHTRLMQHLENNKLVNQIQYGFRKNHSTTDALLRLQTFVKENRALRRHTAAIFFDLKKAYDTIWKYGLIRDLPLYNVRGHLAKYICNFLKDRTFRVKVGTSLSPIREQREGVPQGSVLSCSLFLLAINSIASVIPPDTNGSLFVDDIMIFASSARQPLLERRLQLAVNRIEKWATEHGLKFAQTKTVGIYFRSHHQIIRPPSITIYNEPITFNNQAKFLGMTIDSKLTWNNHITHLKAECIKRTQALKCLSHRAWGADRTSMLRVYRTIIRSKLDYGCIVYQTAKHTTLAKLNPVHNSAIRLCTGAFRSSPTASLYIESGEPPLHLRRKQLSLQYAVRVLQTPRSLAWNCIHTLDNDSGQLTLTIPTSDPDPIDFQLPTMRVMRIIPRKLPFWRIPISVFCGGWKHQSKAIENPIILRGQFLEHKQQEHGGTFHLYTDGSKNDDAVGFAVVSDGEMMAAHRLLGEASVYTSELMALAEACAIACSREEETTTIFTDSKSALDALHRVDSNHPIIQLILLRILRVIATEEMSNCAGYPDMSMCREMRRQTRLPELQLPRSKQSSSITYLQKTTTHILK